MLMANSSVILLVLVAFLGTATAKLPPFSWDTLPVFYHSSNQSGDFNEEALKTIAKFSMVTIEKMQGYDVKTVDDEDAMVVAMKQVKKMNPNIGTYFYMNSFKEHPEMTRMARQANERKGYLLEDDKGNKVKNGQGFHVFDLSKEEVRKWWMDTCLNATKVSGGDGCFCDSSQHTSGDRFKLLISKEKQKLWGEGLLNLTRDVQNALGEDNLLIGKVSDQPYVKAAQIEFFSPTIASINNLTEGARNGKVMQAHVPISVDCSSDLTDYMAAFLIGAGKYAYFGCGLWQATGDDTRPLTWREEYDKPLGEPEPAVYKDGMWSRKFASGTVATFDTLKNTGTITWAKS